MYTDNRRKRILCIRCRDRRSIAIRVVRKRSSEVWQVLGAVKTEFGKFGDVLAKVKSQTETVLNTLSSAEQRSRVMGKALRNIEALPEADAARLIPLDKKGLEPD